MLHIIHDSIGLFYIFWIYVQIYLFCWLLQLDAAKCLGQTLRRYTGLNHLAQAARAVLQNSAQINQVNNVLGVDLDIQHVIYATFVYWY